MLAFAISYVKPIFVAKYLIVSLPALVLLVALGLASIPRRWVAAILLVALLAVSGRELAAFYGSRGLEDWRHTTAPEIVTHLREQGADALILAPA